MAGGKARQRAARTLHRWGDHLSGQYWRTDTIIWSRYRPRRFRSADELRGFCLRIQDEFGRSDAGVTLRCTGGVIAVGPGFEGVAEGLDLYSPADRRTLVLSENDAAWHVRFGSSWRTGEIPLEIGAVSRDTDPVVHMHCLNGIRIIELSTVKYGRWRHFLRAPVVEAYTGRDVRTRAHDLKITTFAVAGGVLAGGLSGWLAGILARPPG